MKRTNLTKLYDTINRIAAEHEARGISRRDWFLTDDEFAAVKSDKRNMIL